MKKKQIILTGHTRGIGMETLQLLLNKGFSVTGIARTKIEQEKSQNLTQFQFDLAKENELLKVGNKLKSIDCNAIILNAGFNHIKPADAYSPEEIIKIITLNLTAHAVLIRACLPSLLKNKGWIIAIGSYSGTEVEKWNNYYGAAKAGLHHLQNNLFEQYRKQGIKTCTIIPDITNSSFYNHQQIAPSNNPETFIEPGEIAKIILDILGKNSGYIPTQLVIRPQRLELIKKQRIG